MPIRPTAFLPSYPFHQSDGLYPPLRFEYDATSIKLGMATVSVVSLQQVKWSIPSPEPNDAASELKDPMFSSFLSSSFSHPRTRKKALAIPSVQCKLSGLDRLSFKDARSCVGVFSSLMRQMSWNNHVTSDLSDLRKSRTSFANIFANRTRFSSSAMWA